MAYYIKEKYKICFVFLLFVVFLGLATMHVANISIQPSKIWLTGVAQHFHSYLPTHIQGVSNHSLIKKLLSLQNKPTDGEQLIISTLAPMTTTSRLNATETTNQYLTTGNILMMHYHEAYPRNYQFIMNEPDICKQQEPFLVLMVPVAPQQLEARNAIRSTWGNESVVQGKNITVLFVVGLTGREDEAKQQEQLILESQQYHDLIQSNFIDTYRNLTIKTMVIMDWLAKHCPQASYAMKIDSDMFLNVENLISLLIAQDTPKVNYMTGMVMWDRPVIRDQYSKWYVPKESFPEDTYPTYLLGMGYVFSNDLPEKLVNASKDVPAFNIEDAYIGACLKRLGLSPSTAPDPSKFKAYYSGAYNHNEFSRVITTILSSPNQLVTFWQQLKMST